MNVNSFVKTDNMRSAKKMQNLKVLYTHNTYSVVEKQKAPHGNKKKNFWEIQLTTENKNLSE